MINYESVDHPLPPKNIYLFNVETSWEIEADTEEEAYERLPGGLEHRYATIIDQDVMLVDIIPNA